MTHGAAPAVFLGREAGSSLFLIGRNIKMHYILEQISGNVLGKFHKRSLVTSISENIFRRLVSRFVADDWDKIKYIHRQIIAIGIL